MTIKQGEENGQGKTIGSNASRGACKAPRLVPATKNLLMHYFGIRNADFGLQSQYVEVNRNPE